MASFRWSLSAAVFAAGVGALVQPVVADYYTLILQGNVLMPDGSPPPRTVGIERICSDIQGSAPGPIADKKGHYLWKQDIDPENTRSCFLRATLAGFISTRVDLGNINLGDIQQNKVLNMPDIVLAPRDSGEGNSVSLIPADEAPGKAQAPYKLAMKALDAGNADEAMQQLQLAVKAVPKFAEGWTILGAVYEQHDKLMEARDALQHAIEANPKAASPYLRLARISNKLGDFDAAAKNEDALLKIENRYYPEVFLQQAITRMERKDYAGAEESAKMAISLDVKHLHVKRAEYVLGRIALAKGDNAAAKQHIAAYVSLDPTAPDIERIQAQLDTIGTADAPKLDISLGRP